MQLRSNIPATGCGKWHSQRLAVAQCPFWCRCWSPRGAVDVGAIWRRGDCRSGCCCCCCCCSCCSCCSCHCRWPVWFVQLVLVSWAALHTGAAQGATTATATSKDRGFFHFSVVRAVTLATNKSQARPQAEPQPIGRRKSNSLLACHGRYSTARSCSSCS